MSHLQGLLYPTEFDACCNLTDIHVVIEAGHVDYCSSFLLMFFFFWLCPNTHIKQSNCWTLFSILRPNSWNLILFSFFFNGGEGGSFKNLLPHFVGGFICLFIWLGGGRVSFKNLFWIIWVHICLTCPARLQIIACLLFLAEVTGVAYQRL